jgi:hypothetical protein
MNKPFGIKLNKNIQLLGVLVIASFFVYFLLPWEAIDQRETVLVTGGLGLHFCIFDLSDVRIYWIYARRGTIRRRIQSCNL